MFPRPSTTISLKSSTPTPLRSPCLTIDPSGSLRVSPLVRCAVTARATGWSSPAQRSRAQAKPSERRDKHSHEERKADPEQHGDEPRQIQRCATPEGLRETYRDERDIADARDLHDSHPAALRQAGERKEPRQDRQNQEAVEGEEMGDDDQSGLAEDNRGVDGSLLFLADTLGDHDAAHRETGDHDKEARSDGPPEARRRVQGPERPHGLDHDRQHDEADPY